VNHPVIIKLVSATDKRLIYSHLKKLKTYNTLRCVMNLKPQYVTEHLPKKFQEERRLLLPVPVFKEAQEAR